MIFVTVGSQKFQFNRLLEEIDKLVEKEILNSNDVFAQVGYSSYTPSLYSYKKFLDNNEFIEAIEKSEIIITHGGTGSIVNSVKKRKKVIAIPRLKQYGEHVDNHQVEIIEQFNNSNMIMGITNVTELGTSIEKVKNTSFRPYNSNTENVIKLVDDFLLNNIK